VRHRRVLIGLSAVIVLWVAAIFAAPVALGSSHRTFSYCAAAVYAAGSRVCHQRPERSFHIVGRQMPVCARCTGVYVSAAAAIPFVLFVSTGMMPRHARTLLAVAALPTAVTWLLEFTGVMPFSNLARAFAALPLGFVAAWLVLAQLAPRGRIG